MVFMSVVVLTLVFLILRLDDVVAWSYTITLIPAFVLLFIALSYYSVRSFTKKLSTTVLKNPFSIVTNGAKNNAEMDVYLI